MTNENDRDNETTPAENNSNNTNNTTQNLDEVQNIISNQKIYLEVLKKEYNIELAKKQRLRNTSWFYFCIYSNYINIFI